jgi:hypothetical protein
VAHIIIFSKAASPNNGTEKAGDLESRRSRGRSRRATYTGSDGQTYWMIFYYEDIVIFFRFLDVALALIFRSAFEFGGRVSRKSYTWILSGVCSLCFTPTCVSLLSFTPCHVSTCAHAMIAQDGSRHHLRQRSLLFFPSLFDTSSFSYLPYFHVHRIVYLWDCRIIITSILP